MSTGSHPGWAIQMKALFKRCLTLDGNPHDDHLEKAVIVALHGGDTDGILRSLWAGGHDPTTTMNEWLAFCSDLVEDRGAEAAGHFFSHLEAAAEQWDPSTSLGTLPGIMM